MSEPTSESGASDKSKYQLELEALPEWVQKMVLACQGMRSYGFDTADDVYGEDKYAHQKLMYTMKNEQAHKFAEGADHMMGLARALSAPWPPPPPPVREKRAFNIVEMMDHDDDGGSAFDQPCAFGNRCGGHAVYCHNDAWPDSPRKCRRTWYTGGEVKDEDCPGYVANPDYAPKAQP